VPKKKRSIPAGPKTRTLPAEVPEYAVDRETLMAFFRPPVSESTFYKLQKEGYIMPVEAVSGRYRLNLSLTRLGLKPVTELPKTDDESARRDRVVRLGLWLMAPDLIERPPWLLTRDPTDAEQSLAVLTALYIVPRFTTLATDYERRAFVQGCADAGHLLGREDA